MQDNHFYHVRNIEAKCDNYSPLNEVLEEALAGVRLGPALTKKGNPSCTLDQTMIGIYMRKEDWPLKFKKYEAKITLQEAEHKLERMIEKGVQRIGHETL